MNRRTFLLTGIGASSALLLSPRGSLAAEGRFTISFDIKYGFTDSEERLIDKALQYVANRFTDYDIRDNMYDLKGTGGYFLAGGVWEKSNLEEDSDYDGYGDLLRFQLIQLRVKGRKDDFPTINIYPYHERKDVWARAPLSTVSVISKGSNFSVEGEFKVKLNRWMLGANIRNGKDPEFWGGVIVHEMLHNLGHKHEDTSDHWQINAFENCFYWNGNYKRGRSTPDWYCGPWM
ncbi:MAG: hypothetical protein KDA84_20120 [Planctomycetaceae bacterium]|nr:hypothetical protein [Planctomycetaceae bacterium]